jgi:4-oxalmesaconate hydratase
MIIDCHGHYTTAPAGHEGWRRQQLAEGAAISAYPRFSDDELRATVEATQLRLQRERGIDVTLFSPRAGGMGHHQGGAAANRDWAMVCNDLIARVCGLYPSRFVPVCQLPQAPGERPDSAIAELRRCITELGFVGCNLNPDPSGGWWKDPPLTDPWWFPLFEVLVELDVPAMVHVSSSCNPNFHFTGAHYINADTTAFMQMLTADLFARFPTLRLIIPHGGGAVPYHWGRYRGLAQDMGRGELEALMGENVFFDTCVYHQPGIDLLTTVVPVRNVLFASEMHGAVRSIDPRTGHYFDDTRRYIDAAPLSDADRSAIYRGNALRAYPGLRAALAPHHPDLPDA